MAASSPSVTESEPSFNPGQRYVHLYALRWADSSGETHLKKDCRMSGFNPVPFSTGSLQYTKKDLPQVSRMIMSTLSPSSVNPFASVFQFHPCPQPQFVVCMSGAWHIRTSDGDEVTLEQGSMLWQDNVSWSPAAKEPQHLSWCADEQPCTHLIVQCDSWSPRVDEVAPFD